MTHDVMTSLTGNRHGHSRVHLASPATSFNYNNNSNKTSIILDKGKALEILRDWLS